MEVLTVSLSAGVKIQVAEIAVASALEAVDATSYPQRRPPDVVPMVSLVDCHNEMKAFVSHAGKGVTLFGGFW
jgi:hypothetical protein